MFWMLHVLVLLGCWAALQYSMLLLLLLQLLPAGYGGVATAGFAGVVGCSKHALPAAVSS
jgi:hypothetical protein